MESMTGYAFVERSTDTFSFSVEIKSLNSRYLETFIYLPKQLRSEEFAINSVLKKIFTRGKLELNLEIIQWVESKPVSINSELVKKYYKELCKIKESLKIKGELPFESVIALEGLTQRVNSGIPASVKKEIIAAVEEAAAKNIAMRIREGKSIRKDLTESLKQIKLLSARTSVLAKKSAADKKQALINKMKSIKPAIEDSRVFSEVAVMVDRLDINEETIRLGDHIKKFYEIMDENDQTGRRLDFLAQEMFREINTMGSKSNSSEISHIIVDLKNHIDRIREHCRNIV